MKRRVLREVGQNGLPIAVHEWVLQSTPYPANGFDGFLHHQTTPLIVLADSGTTPGYIYRYDYERNRVRVYQLAGDMNSIVELALNTPVTTTVRFLVIYDMIGQGR